MSNKKGDITRLPKEHLGGVEFFRFPDLKSLDVQGYFDCIKTLRPLLNSFDFRDATPGFYINYITVPDDHLNSLRITYYTIDPIKTQETIQKFVNQNFEKISLFNSQWTGRASALQPLDIPHEEELSFRNFLNRNTQIVLGLLESYDREQLRKLVFDYRHTQLPQRVEPEVFLGDVFNQYSNYLRQLKIESLDIEYWQGLTHLFHGRDPGVHFLVNMLALPEAQYYLASPQELL